MVKKQSKSERERESELKAFIQNSKLDYKFGSLSYRTQSFDFAMETAGGNFLYALNLFYDCLVPMKMHNLMIIYEV